MNKILLSFFLFLIILSFGYSAIYPYSENKVKSTKLAQPPKILPAVPFRDGNGVEGLEFQTFNINTRTFSSIRVPNGALIERLHFQEPPLIIRPGTAIQIPESYRLIYYQDGEITVADGPILFVGDYLHTMNGLSFGKGTSEVIGVIKKGSSEDELFCGLRDSGMLGKRIDDDRRAFFTQNPDGPLRIISRFRYEAYTSPKMTGGKIFRKSLLGDTIEATLQKTSDLKKLEDKEIQKIDDIISKTLKPEKDLALYSVIGFRYAFMNAPAYLLFYFYNNQLMRASVVHFPIECDWKYPETRNQTHSANSVVEAFGDAGPLMFGDNEFQDEKGWSVIKAVEQTKQNRVAEEQYVARITEALLSIGFNFYRDSKGLTEEKIARTGWFLGDSTRSFTNKTGVTAELEKRELRVDGKFVSYVLLEMYDKFLRYKLLAEKSSDRILEKNGKSKPSYQSEQKGIEDGQRTSLSDLGGISNEEKNNEVAITSVPEITQEPPPGYIKAKIKEPEFQNMRRDPNGKSEIVAQLPTGEIIFVEKSNAKWIKAIRPKDNSNGYVFREMLGDLK